MNLRRHSTRWAVGLYLLLFFGYLFGPLVIMAVTAFNSSPFPRVYPWECLSFEWFGKLVTDQRLMTGLRNSLLIGLGVVSLSVALGLAGALLLTQIWPRARSSYYTLMTAPILMPGVVIGISTVLFWDRVAVSLGASYDSALYNGLFLTVLGQSCFIASYCMLVFVARLQRFDMQLLDAALDLGASNAQAFRKILLPFLKPAIASAAVIAFLASFENYNTSVFTISHHNSFTIEVAQKVRLGIDPSISALAVIVIFMSLFAALAREGWTMAAEHGSRERGLIGSLLTNTAGLMAVAVLLLAIIVSIAATRYDPGLCKAAVLQEKQRRMQPMVVPVPAAPRQPSTVDPMIRPVGPVPGSFGDVFAPGNLQLQKDREPADTSPAPGSAAPPVSPGRGAFGDIFSPGNLVAPPATSNQGDGSDVAR